MTGQHCMLGCCYACLQNKQQLSLAQAQLQPGCLPRDRPSHLGVCVNHAVGIMVHIPISSDPALPSLLGARCQQLPFQLVLVHRRVTQLFWRLPGECCARAG